MNVKPASISPDEFARRLEILADTRHSIELDGGSVPADAEAVHQQWANGEITLVEMREAIGRLYPSTFTPR
ncbi:antitoxin VbhA family protein [Agromyces sp. NPDC058104]|uniref:antitoxin VbhA family protein n=1 Tax=Agromyces sp. NPDC058104 TaxID=3346342 RepID=UPI0036DC4032